MNTSDLREPLSQARDHRETHGEGKGFPAFGQGRCRLTQSQLDRLKRLYETHGTFCAVTAITGACKETLRKYKALGWKLQPDPKRLPPPSDLALMASKMSIKELRRHYGVSQLPLYRWLRELGIERDYKSKRVYEPIPRPPKDELARMVREIGVGATARHYGVDPATLRRWRHDYGLPVALWRRNRVHRAPVGWVERYVQSEEYRRAA